MGEIWAWTRPAWRADLAPVFGGHTRKARQPEWLLVQLEDFELSSLQPIEWQPYQQGGNTP